MGPLLAQDPNRASPAESDLLGVFKGQPRGSSGAANAVAFSGAGAMDDAEFVQLVPGVACGIDRGADRDGLELKADPAKWEEFLLSRSTGLVSHDSLLEAMN
jgi:hypothetical protein